MSASLPNISNMCVNEQCELNAYTFTKVRIFSLPASSSVPFSLPPFQIGDDRESVVFKANCNNFFFF